RGIRTDPRIAPLITALGVSFFLENGAQLVLGAQFRSYDTFSWKNNPIALNGFTLPAQARVSYAQVIVVVGTVVLMVVLTLFVQRTQTGKAMRATSFDREAAAMMGIDVDRVIVVTFFIGSALAGAAGVFNCIAYQQLWPYMGFQAGLFAFTAAVVGGIGNLPGAVLGGLLIGLAAAFLPLITTNDYIVRVGFDTLLYMLLALGLNITVGYAGLLDLGYVAFYGFGAYAYAMLASPQFGLHWDTLAIIPVVVIATALLGLLVALPSRRLLGDYLAILTLFFGQLFVTVYQNGNQISILGLTRHYNVTGGPNGIPNVDNYDLGGLKISSVQGYYFTALVMFLVVLAVVYLIDRSRTG